MKAAGATAVVALGLASVGPVLWILHAVGVILLLAVDIDPPFTALLLHPYSCIVIGLLQLVLLAVYLSDLFRAWHLRARRFLWLVALLAWWPISFPTYWYIYFWRRPPHCDPEHADCAGRGR
jgi:hypothetical protein